MGSLLKMTLFCLATVGFFTVYSNLGIPQIVPEPPPDEEALDLSAMTMNSFIAVGERLFSGKGTCTLCHTELGGRAPMLDDGTSVAARIEESRYQGSATNVGDYLLESMTEPSAYVVRGFGTVGSNDTVSPMPSAAGPGIALSEAEMLAVIAYIQDLGGLEVTVSIPTGAPATAEVEPSAPAPASAAPRTAFTSGEEIIVGLGCGACHKIAGQAGIIGPDLTRVGSQRDREYLRRSILDPNADVAEGFAPGLMPPIYGEQLYASELEMLVDYMAGLKQ